MSLFNFESPAWMLDAICSTVDPELMFPEKGTTPRAARALCADCPVATQCLEYAITSEEPLYGIWGGTTERDRRPLRKARGIGYGERSHCRNRHAYTDENTGYDSKGHRMCLTCKAATEKRHREQHGPSLSDEPCEFCGQLRPIGNERFCSLKCASEWKRSDQDYDPLTHRKPSRRQAARKAAVA